MSAFEDVIAAMCQPSFYPHDVDVVEVRETAISVVFLAGDRAYKVKRRVTLPFLNYADPARRRALCHEEVRLNRRLAPGVYLGVRSIVRDGERLVLADDRSKAEEWAVEMLRLPEGRTLAALLDAGRLSVGDVRAVARRLAAFHQSAEAPPDPPGPGAVKRPSDENFQTLLDVGLTDEERRRVASAARFFDAFLAARHEELAQRAASGRVRDGHGDLRLEHVLLLDGDVLAYDCIEFDAALRRIDVAADLAFLVMELIARERADLAWELLRAYREAGGDCGDDALVCGFAAYRAWVRAKVAYVQGERPRWLVEVAEMMRWRARMPLILVTCGTTASGKSTLASRLERLTGLPVLGSDRLRKELAGLPATARASERVYAPGHSRRTYRELGERARAALANGGAIVDATCRRRAERRALLIGLGAAAASAVFVECVAPRKVLRERARERERDRERVTDATATLVDEQLVEWQPLDEIAAESHVSLRTDRPLATIVDDLEALLDRRMTVAPRLLPWH